MDLAPMRSCAGPARQIRRVALAGTVHARGLGGLLRDKTRPPGRKPLDPAVIEHVVALTAEDPPGETTHWTSPSLLAGLAVRHANCNRMTPSHAVKNGRRYRYYVPPAGQGRGDIAERDARAGSPDRATRHRSDPAAFQRTQPDRGGRAIPAQGYPAPRHGPRDPCARLGGAKNALRRHLPQLRCGTEEKNAT